MNDDFKVFENAMIPKPTPEQRQSLYIQKSREPIPIKKRSTNPKKGRSDKLRATSWIWFGQGFGHVEGAEEKNALKLIEHIKLVFDLP